MNPDSSKDKRRHRRVSIVKEIEVDGSRGRRVTDISIEGMYIDTVTPFAVGSTVELKFRLDDPEDTILGPVTVRAKVLYSQEGLGVGVQFIDLKSEDRSRITRLIDKI